MIWFSLPRSIPSLFCIYSNFLMLRVHMINTIRIRVRKSIGELRDQSFCRKIDDFNWWPDEHFMYACCDAITWMWLSKYQANRRLFVPMNERCIVVKQFGKKTLWHDWIVLLFQNSTLIFPYLGEESQIAVFTVSLSGKVFLLNAI